MQKVTRIGVVVAALAVAAWAQADDSGYPWRETGYIPVAVGTPQETLLAYQVMFPDPSVWGPGPYPVIVDYSGYEPATTIWDGLDDRMLAAGYAMAGVNMRGTHTSGGTFDYFNPQQAKDGADAITWLSKRSWCTGRVAMAGKSWPGISQLYVAEQQPEGLVAIVPGHVFSDLYRDVAFPGGIMNVTFDGYWSIARIYQNYLTGPITYADYNDEQILLNQLGHLPDILYNPFIRVLTNQYDDAFYHERSNWYRADKIKVPTFLVLAWQDEEVGSRAVDIISRFNSDLKWRFLGTNGDHGEYYGPEVFPHILRFLSYYVKQQIPAGDQRMVTEPLILPNGKPHPTKMITRPETYKEALTRYESEDRVMINWENGAKGDRRANWWQTYGQWPPANQTVWRLNLFPDGTLREDSYPEPPAQWLLGSLTPRDLGSVDYAYVPLYGTQERGGYNIEAPFVGVEAVPPASWSDRPPDGTFAEFTTAPLTEDKVLLGSASVDLTIMSTAEDTDFEVTLSEIRPDGYETFVQQGWLRASHRREDTSLSTPLRPYQTHQFTDAELLIPGQPTKVRIEIFPFGHVFRKGSRLRIAISAPHTHPDLWGFAPMPAPAVNTILTSQVYPSSIALPLLAGDTAQAPYPPVGSLRNEPDRVAEETPASPLAPLDNFSLDAWTDRMYALFGLSDYMHVLDGAGLPDTSTAGWLSQWLDATGQSAPTVDLSNPDIVSPAAYSDWQTEVETTSFDPNASDDWFVQWFDSWYADWQAQHPSS